MAWLASGLSAVGSGLGAAGSAVGSGLATAGQYAAPVLQGIAQGAQIAGQFGGTPQPSGAPMGPSMGQPLTPIGLTQMGQQQQPEWYVNPQTNRLSRRFLPTIL